MATANVQRRWQAACPNCGAPVEFASSASASAVCSFCRSTLLRDGDTLRKIGLSAELIEDYSPLQLGAAGRYLGEAFSIVGRLQFGEAQGSWNEWHALFDSGKSAWLSEDNGSFVLAFDAQLDERLPQAHELVLGAQQVLAGQSWSVAALTMAKLLAAQGELPRPPANIGSGREFLVAELRNARNEVGSLDYSEPERPQWSVGRPVRLAELAMSGLRDENATTAKALASRALPCPNCGAPLTPQLGNTKSIVCAQCSAVVDISNGAGADLAFYAQQNGLAPQLPLGSTGTLAVTPGRPLPWQIVGYQERCDLPGSGDDEQTFWREYLLFNQTEGFAFLVDTDEGWSVVRPLTGAPRASAGAAGGVEWQGKAYRRRFRYAAKVTHVLGEFYWKVEREARTEVTDYEAKTGPELLSSELTGSEMVWSHGRKLDAAEVARAFALPAGQQAALVRDASSLSSSGGGSLLRKIVIGVFILIVIALLLRSCGGDDCAQYRDSYGEASAEYAQCKQRSGGGRIYPGGGGGYGGGSYGGYSGGGGGHK